jgi:CDP-paratose 2-epimerase
MRTTLITGGAGFIGSNLADRLVRAGRRVIVFDNLSRQGAEHNLEWLQNEHGSAIEFHQADIRNRSSIRRALAGVDQVFHFAAQVAVTTSLTNAIEDFDINAGGTLNLLEEIRSSRMQPGLIFTSTNKVYGQLDDLEMRPGGSRYESPDPTIRYQGISEQRRLDFHSPYGCSKGSADQYVLDYARTFGVRATVFRMSCIYGPHQYGNEDQGWVAHFLIRALENSPVTIYGDGLQVRDILYIDDLLDAFQLAEEHIDKISGQAFNIGGGPKNTVSLRELLGLIESVNGRRVGVRNEAWRAADQRYYVSDTRKFEARTGWRRNFDVHRGVRALYDWLSAARSNKVVAAGQRVLA